jgi:hypothetical protein
MKHPQMRFCQLIHNVFKGDAYYIEDEGLIEKLESHYGKLERGD